MNHEVAVSIDNIHDEATPQEVADYLFNNYPKYAVELMQCISIEDIDGFVEQLEKESKDKE